MSIKAVLFDLDATLLPMNQDEFLYFHFPDASMESILLPLIKSYF